ncbi:hypothetical protein [Burkholderia guangdongensis]|uniref:hypothetical protein n=1 Tax=Burkholderia guangdongensis TaxID=1792500 RepID=UPI001FE571DF|nr:hypothetical protein [Burkholderia guangdongensis]
MDKFKTEAEISKLTTEATKLAFETLKLHAESVKLHEEGIKLRRESRWLPVIWATAFVGAVTGVARMLN